MHKTERAKGRKAGMESGAVWRRRGVSKQNTRIPDKKTKKRSESALKRAGLEDEKGEGGMARRSEVGKGRTVEWAQEKAIHSETAREKRSERRTMSTKS